MKCEEPMPKPGETFSYRDCQLGLGHPGAHEYFGEKLARPIPSGALDPDISDLIEQAAGHNAWNLDELAWPVVVTVTSVYVIKAYGATEDEALASLDGGDFPDLDGEQAIDGGWEISRADYYQRSSLLGAPFGPTVACPDCGAQAMRRSWLHNPLRRCHGPIVWRENEHARDLRWRYRREIAHTPALPQEVAA